MNTATTIQKAGKVIFIGGCHGDPELLPLKALRHLALADIVLQNGSLCDNHLHQLAPRATIVPVSRLHNFAGAISPENSNDLLVQYALSGKHVVQFMDEAIQANNQLHQEMAVLNELHIQYELVPGIATDITSDNENKSSVFPDLASIVEALNPDALPRYYSTEKPNKWKRIATYSLVVFASMLVGHFILSYIPFKALADGTIDFYLQLDKNFGWILLAGFLAQIIDGSLGMGYGITSATIMLSVGVHPAVMSGSIHTAEMFASGASGLSHYRFGNVNKKLFKALVIPGVIGAILGALLLVSVGDSNGKYLRPVMAGYMLFLGFKFIFNAFKKNVPKRKFKQYKLLAGTGGFLDSFGGGGWGPLVTSTLINRGRTPRFVIGTVSLTEFFVTLASAFSFFILIGVSHWQAIVALIAGSFIAAPIGARLAGKMPRKTAFLLLGILVIFWSVRILFQFFL